MKLAKKKSIRGAKKKPTKKVKPEAKKKPKGKGKHSSDKKSEKQKDKKAGKLKLAGQNQKKSAPKSGKKKDKPVAVKATATKAKTKPVTGKSAPKKSSTQEAKPNTQRISKPAAKKVAKKVAKKPAVTFAAKKKGVARKTAAAARKKKPAETKKEATGAGPKAKASKKTVPAGKIKKKLPDIPALLLEGDEPHYPERRGPGSRYDTGMPAPSRLDTGQDLALPEAYGTKRIHLVARDPQWLYAHWDLTNEQLQTYNQLSRSGHLTLQVFENEISGKPKVQIDVHPESRSWFAHVGKGGGVYYAVLGFHDKLGDWQEISVSQKASTPPDSLSDDMEATFTSIPVSIPFSELIKVVREYAANEPKLAKALSLLQQANIPESAGFSVAAKPSTGAPKWSRAQQQALADAVSMDEVRRVWIGSEEVLELIKGRVGLSSEAAIPTSGISSITSLSSPFGGEQAKGGRGFWFNVNAELIIYGATEPDASVTIGEREIKLRADGTFSYRFALPDGQYELPIAATSADKVETRHADLEFARGTEYRGDVGQHPQDAALKKPSSENVS